MSTRYSLIPRSAEEVPLQMVYPYVDLPPRPSSLKMVRNAFEPMPINIRPKGSPRNTQYLGSVEWADSPNHTRFDSYYLNPRGAYWLLWIGYQDENTWNWKWTWNLYAYCKKKGIDEKTAATYLLMDAWASERDTNDLDKYFLIDEEGMLSIGEITEIARRVWWREL